MTGNPSPFMRKEKKKQGFRFFSQRNILTKVRAVQRHFPFTKKIDDDAEGSCYVMWYDDFRYSEESLSQRWYWQQHAVEMYSGSNDMNTR